MSTDSSSALEQIAKVVALAASLSLPASVLFDFGLFGGLGLSMRQVPTSLVDHAKSAVFWFPFALAYAILFAGGQMLAVRASANTKVINSGLVMPGTVVFPPNVAAILSRWISWFSLLVGVVSLTGYVLIGDSLYVLLVGGVGFLWLSFATWSIIHPSVVRRWPTHQAISILFIPVVAWTLWGGGRMIGMALSVSPLSTKVTVAGNATPQDVAVIRYMDKGLLVRTRQGGAEFLQWSSIVKVDSPAKQSVNTGLLCRWLRKCDTVGTMVDNFKGMAD